MYVVKKYTLDLATLTEDGNAKTGKNNSKAELFLRGLVEGKPL
jgi:hypothetical protein